MSDAPPAGLVDPRELRRPAAVSSAAAASAGAGHGSAAPAAAGRGPGRLFAYGARITSPEPARDDEAHPIPRGPYAVVHVVTTGFTPLRDRIVEVAVVRAASSGRIEDEWSTLLHPGDRDLGPTFWHGLIGPDVADAPRFADVAATLLGRLEGAVVVAHRAPHVEAFLAAEVLASGRLAPTFPALDTFRLAQHTVVTRNHRLATLAAHAGLSVVPSGAALPDARLVAALLPHLVAPHEDRLRYPVPPAESRTAPAKSPTRPRTHLAPRPTPDAWLVALLSRVRTGARETHDPRVATYVEALTATLTLGRIATEETRALTRLAAEAGYSAGDIRGIVEHLLESLRDGAFEERRLTQAQLRHLRATAASLGVPGYFDDLIPPSAAVAPAPGSGSFARPVRKPPPPAPTPWATRCAHCLKHGHYTASCPRLRERSRTRGPVPPVDRIAPI